MEWDSNVSMGKVVKLQYWFAWVSAKIFRGRKIYITKIEISLVALDTVLTKITKLLQVINFNVFIGLIYLNKFILKSSFLKAKKISNFSMNPCLNISYMVVVFTSKSPAFLDTT